MCPQVQCRDSLVKDSHASDGELNRASACHDSDKKSVIVRVVDRCNCVYPSNKESNKRWCGGPRESPRRYIRAR